MDIVARYLDFTDYHTLVKELGEDADISVFTPIEGIEVQNLEKGAQVRISYDPNRVFVMTYLGDFKFVINQAEGSKNIHQGDILTITQLALRHRFVASHVVRDNLDLGAYESAKFKGLKSIEIVSAGSYRNSLLRRRSISFPNSLNAGSAFRLYPVYTFE